MKAKKVIMFLSAASILLTACGNSAQGIPVVSVSPQTFSEIGAAESSAPESSVPENSEGSLSSADTDDEPSTPEDLPREPIEGDGVISGAELILDSGRCIFLSSTSSVNGANYAQSVNAYKEKFPELNVYSMIVPTAISYYLPEKFKQYDTNEKEHIDEINSQLKDITPVDVYSALARHTDEPIYFNTDHHWTQLGAFYGAEAFAKTAGVDFAPLSEFEERNAGEFVGSAYANSNNDQRILELSEDFIYYIPNSDFSTTFYELDGTGEFSFTYFENPNEFNKFGMYAVYMYGDGHIVRLNTSCKNGRRLLIVKEAFANPFACNLVNSFEEIVIADMKYITTTVTQLIQDHNTTDLLFCLSTLSTSGVNQEFISKIM